MRVRKGVNTLCKGVAKLIDLILIMMIIIMMIIIIIIII